MIGLMFYPNHSGKTNLNYDLNVNRSLALYITIVCTCKIYNTILKSKSEHNCINICHVVHDFQIKVYNVNRILKILYISILPLYHFTCISILPHFRFLFIFQNG